MRTRVEILEDSIITREELKNKLKCLKSGGRFFIFKFFDPFINSQIEILTALINAWDEIIELEKSIINDLM